MYLEKNHCGPFCNAASGERGAEFTSYNDMTHANTFGEH